MKRWDQYKIELPKSRHEAEEFGKAKKGIVICGECRAVYHKKAWHHSLEKLKMKDDRDYPLSFQMCPACKMIRDHQFEGEIKVIGYPAEIKKELTNLIRNFCKRAYERDPMDRLIEIKEDGNNLTVTTTENQLAQKLAKKIREIFKRFKIKISYSAEPGDTVYIEMKFLSL